MENVQSQGNRFLEVSMTRGTKIFLCPLLWVHYKMNDVIDTQRFYGGYDGENGFGCDPGYTLLMAMREATRMV